MKIGVLGTGMIVRQVLPVLMGLKPEKVYLLSRNGSEEKAGAMCRDLGLDGVFYDYDELLAADIDAVYVALPNTLHYDYAKKALLSGKHVLVEKPMAVTLAQVNDLRALAGARGLALMEAMTVHALPAYQAMKRRLKKIGRVRSAIFVYAHRSSRYEAFLNGQVHAVFDPAQAGGALMDLNVYNLQAFLGLFGRPQAFRYQAEVVRGIDVNGGLTLDYGTFHAVAVAAKDRSGSCGGVIEGEEGSIRFEGPVSAITAVSLTDSGGRTDVFSQEGDRLLYELQNFQRAVDSGDLTGLDRLLDITADATHIMEQSRRQAGLCFPGDERE